ncbi:MAG TPA: hypothetical protein VF980_04255 [Thermoanaerobaculia bacterium]
MRRAIVATALTAFACAAPPAPKPAPAPAAKPVERSAAEMVDHAGDSVETAVSVPADADDVKFENNWIYDRIGRFRRHSQGTGSLNGRRYDVIEVETPDGTMHKFFFDITENWNNYKPPE